LRLYGILAWPWVVVFVKVGLGGVGSLLTELTKLKDRHEVEGWFATDAWLFDLSAHFLRELCVFCG